MDNSTNKEVKGARKRRRGQKSPEKIVIIGAGPTGLGAAYRLQELGYEDWEIYEKNSYIGGLSASFRDDKGFTWDIGGHVLFSHYEYVDKLVNQLLGNEYLSHQRDAWIWLLNSWVPYPFQNNIRGERGRALGSSPWGQPPSGWKKYYAIRNRVYTYRKHGKPSFAFYIGLFIGTCVDIRNTLRSDQAKYYNIKLWLSGMFDGLRGKLGKNVNFLPR